MGNNIFILFCFVFSIELAISQYVMFNKKMNKSNPCDARNNALVEQFFNIIFTEFHNTPPVCVCVQMCLDRPTYCYPNGCLRHPMIRKREDTTTTAYPINRIQYNGFPSKSVMFLVDSEKDLADDILESPIINSYSERKEKTNSIEIATTTNPFKELVFKYRKLPKLEMRYNLREKMKHAKSDTIKRDQLDVSRTRWPMNKHFLHGRQLLNRVSHYKRDDETRGTLLISMFPHKVTNNSTFRKFLTKREDVNDTNVDALLFYEPGAANFSIEALIDNLIMDTLNNSKLSNRNNNVKRPNATNESIYLERNIENDIPSKKNNPSINIILINSTNDDMNTNEYIPDSKSSNGNKYLEMIANMTKEIEKNNQMSIELVKQIANKKDVFDTIKSVDSTTRNLEISLNSSIDSAVSEKISTFAESTVSCEPPRTEPTHTELTTPSQKWKIPVLRTPNIKKRKPRIIRKIMGK